MINKKEMLIGFITGLLMPPIGFVIWVLIFTSYSVEKAASLVVQGSLYSEVLSLSAMANMLILYLFLNNKKYFAGRGVLLATILLSLVVVATKLL
ncbi:MAG: hypothetical protein KAH10_06525 [Flavobacteriales bacterium]|nr:hypothetical protein [Flavobacteriales bacterium]